MKLFLSLIFCVLTLCVNAQTRNVVIGSYEQDSLEKANFSNQNFHSQLKSYTVNIDSSDIYGFRKSFSKSTFILLPVTEFSFGYQSESDDKILYNSFLGLNGGYSFSDKLSISASVLGGYSKPLIHRALLADSLGYFPQLGDFKKNDENYFIKYFEFYINYRPVKYLMFSLGKGKKFIGEGLRSVIMSASNSGMYYFDIKVDVRHFNYIFSINGGKNLDSKLQTAKTKWTVYHLFSWNATKWLSFGGFEAVNLVRRDSLNNSRFVDLHYINPLVFTRPVEYSLGSPDNELMGIFGKLKFFNQTFYAQAMIDEFKIGEFKANTGWWANKYSFQAGVKGFFTKGVLKNFSYLFQADYIRPYMYSHDDANNSYSIYNQCYANPYGANLKEFSAQIKYSSRVFTFDFTLDYLSIGKDYPGKYSYGNNVLRSYNTRKQEYDNSVGQGLNVKLLNYYFNLNYQPWFLKNFCLFSQIGVFDENKFFQIGIKTNLIPFDRSF